MAFFFRFPKRLLLALILVVVQSNIQVTSSNEPTVIPP